MDYYHTGTELYLEIHENNHWLDCRESSMYNTRTKIESILGMSYERFISISYMSNKSGNIFLKGSNKDRMELLSDIIGLNEWDSIIEKARKEKSRRSGNINTSTNNMNYTNGILDNMEKNLKHSLSIDWEAAIYNYNNELNSLDKKKEELNKNIEIKNKEINKIENLVNGYKVQEMYESLLLEKENLLKSFNDKKPEREVVEIKSEYTSLVNEKFMLEGKIKQLDEQFNKIKGKNKCPICDSSITDSKVKKFDNSILKIKKRLDIVKSEIIKMEEHHKEQQKEIENEYKIKNKKYNDEFKKAFSNLEESENNYTAIINKIKEFNNKIAILKEKISSDEVQINVLVNVEQTRILNSIEVAKDNIKNINTLKNQIEETKNTIQNLYEDIQVNTIENNLCDWFINNIPYIKLHKLSISMNDLSSEINKYLEEMGDTIRVNVSSFEEKKSKRNVHDFVDMLKSDIKIEVSDGEKIIDLKLYSDGEISKISNAFIRAIHNMSKKHGHGCNIIMLDEIFSFLDKDNSEKLSSSFINKDHDTIIITDNSGIASNLMNFDEIWVARKKNNITNIEVQR